MKLNNLIEELNNKIKFSVSNTTILTGNNAGENRIVLIQESKKPIVLANSIYNYHSYKHLINKTVYVEVYETKLPCVITEDGVMEQKIGYLEEEICQN